MKRESPSCRFTPVRCVSGGWRLIVCPSTVVPVLPGPSPMHTPTRATPPDNKRLTSLRTSASVPAETTTSVATSHGSLCGVQDPANLDADNGEPKQVPFDYRSAYEEFVAPTTGMSESASRSLPCIRSLPHRGAAHPRYYLRPRLRPTHVHKACSE